MWKFIKLYNSYFSVFAIVVGLSILLQFWIGEKFGDPDGYYHVAVAKMFGSSGVLHELPWLQFTTLRDRFADQHFLFHVLLAGFGSIAKAKILIALLGGVVGTIFFGILRQLNIKGAFGWAILLFLGSSGFLYRINLLKAEAIGLMLVLAVIAIIYSKRFWLLLPISALFVLSYGGFVLLPFIVLGYIALEFIMNKKLYWQGFIWMTTGILLGLIIHPGGYNYLVYLSDQLLAPFTKQVGVGIGNEWYPYTAKNLLITTFPILPLWIAGLYSWSRENWKTANLDTKTLWIHSLSLVFFILLLYSRRFVFWYAPFAVISIALNTNHLSRRISIKGIWDKTKEHKEAITALLVFIICVAGITYYTVRDAKGRLSNSQSSDAYKGAATWLTNQSQEKDIVFNTKWDQFPQLFYWNSKNYYIVGLDPTFMYEYNKDLYWKWRTVSDDNPKQWSESTVYDIVKNDFSSKYLFLENYRNPKLKEYLETSEAMKDKFILSYSDTYTSVYIVK